MQKVRYGSDLPHCPDLPRAHQHDRERGIRLCILRIFARRYRNEARSQRISARWWNLKKAKDIPCAVGFGISTPEQAKKMAGLSDGAIVGSAIVKLCGTYGKDAVPYVKRVCEVHSVTRCMGSKNRPGKRSARMYSDFDRNKPVSLTRIIRQVSRSFDLNAEECCRNGNWEHALCEVKCLRYTVLCAKIK